MGSREAKTGLKPVEDKRDPKRDKNYLMVQNSAGKMGTENPRKGALFKFYGET